ncbi:MAG TPA: hypothetical protein VFI17_07750 [Solirubrobacterales bacterium]|nr:hypothetical protein [Solirubrobacterales bacterium]
MKRGRPEPEDLLAAVAEAADDGFLPASSRGPDGQVYLALTSEGWRALRSARASS